MEKKKHELRENWWPLFRREYPELAKLHVMLNRKIRMLKEKWKEVKKHERNE